jgi:hypothetical protein
MPMDKWVFFDCGEMPGGVCGLGVDASELPADVKTLYKIGPDCNDFIPISMYIAIPMAAPNTWFGHNLSSANTVLGGAFQGLGLLTKVLALKVFNIKLIYGATQWDSKSLNIHLQISDMEMMSSYTPAHSCNKTITYKSYYNDEILFNSLRTAKASITGEFWQTLKMKKNYRSTNIEMGLFNQRPPHLQKVMPFYQ